MQTHLRHFGIALVLFVLPLTFLSVLFLSGAAVPAAARSKSASIPLLTMTPTPMPSATCVAAWGAMTAPGGTAGSELRGSASLAVDNVWAAGVSSIGATEQTLIEHWNGTAWSIVPSPNRGSGNNVLNGMATDAPNDIWAVGAASGILIEHSDGTSWSIVPTPDVGPDAVLFGAAALSTNDAWAVGTIGSTGNQTLILHWDGTSWTQSPSPAIGMGYVYLQDVDMFASDDVWAVGYEADTMGILRYTLALHWDGASWTRVGTPQPGFEQQFFEGVSTAAANDAWAVGYYHDGGPNPTWRTLIARWNGSTWQQVPSPDAGDFNFLYGVKVAPTGDVWAVGSHKLTSNSYSAPLVEHWTGSSWSVTPSEAVPGMDSGLLAIDICSTNHPRAVGYRGEASSRSVLVEQYSTECTTPCPITFTDVHTTDYFYEDVRCVYCMGAVSGYADGTFRPFNNTTRGQISKIIAIGLQIPISTPTGTPTFSDVQPGDPFYEYVETLAAHNIISGYADGTFRPNNYVTRGQLSKIDATAAALVFGWSMLNPAMPSFSDVPPGSAFYPYVETAVCHGIISGYADGTFRPQSEAIRAQIAKIVCHTAQNPPECGGSTTPTPGPTQMPGPTSTPTPAM